MIIYRTCLLFLVSLVSVCAIAQVAQPLQEDITIASQHVSSEYLDKISAKADQFNQKLDQQSARSLQQLRKQEAKIERKLTKIDSLKALAVFGNTEQQYRQLEERLQQATILEKYIPSLDTLGSSLKFLQQNPQLLSQAKQARQKLKEAVGKIKGLENRFQKAEEIRIFLKERRQYLKEQLGRLGFARELKKINKQVYYYSEQLNEYKAMLKDHKKAERKAIELLSKTKLFKDFMRKHSQLASLFRLPDDDLSPTGGVGGGLSLAGLQTRAQVNNLIQQQLAAGGPGAQQQFQQNLQEAQGQLNQLKNKITQYGSGSSDDIMPEGFKPNEQKTKSFLKRLEWGTNMQSQKANGYFPVTSDLGISLGYKMNDKSVFGIGASYKLGLGQNIRYINVTHQGVGLRSFVDWKIKGSFWISGGFEMNYRNEFNRVDVLRNLNAWQQSGLLGVSKVVSLKTKFFKKTKLQLLWDFMNYRQVPQTQAVVFRVGYQF